jgi:hypothetical protein
VPRNERFSFRNTARFGLHVLLYAMASSCTAIPHAGGEKEKKVEQPGLPLGLTDADYWIDPFKTRSDLESKLMEEGKEALLLGAPGKISIAEHDSLPVVAIRTANLDRLARRVFRKHAVLTAVDQATGQTYAYMAVVKNVKEPKQYDGPPLEGMGGEAFLIDAKSQLGLPWAPARYVVGLVLLDQVSNRVAVELKKGGYDDPAVADYLKGRDKSLAPPSPFPAPAVQTDGAGGKQSPVFPYYSPWAGSPPLPEGAGISILADRVVPRGPRTACVIRGSFRLPVRNRDFVKQAPVHDPNVRPHTAVVPITLLLTGGSSSAPVLIPLLVPTYDPVDANAESAVATGWFSVDAAKLKNIAGADETFFIYAFSGESMAGPVPMALVKP